MPDLTPVFLEPLWPVEPLHILNADCWCNPTVCTVDDTCTCEHCLEDES
jgi:hypothetical protein